MQIVNRSAYVLLLACCLSAVSAAQISFKVLDREVIESRIKDFSRKNEERETILKRLFAASRCKQEEISEQPVKNKMPPNVMCVLPGGSPETILVGAHYDHADVGDGVVDNWSGASLLPSLVYSLAEEDRHHTFVFIGFSGEERGMLGSEFYAKHLTPEQRSRYVAVVNLDTLGLGPTEVWATHSDRNLTQSLAAVANAMKLPVSAMNVDRVGTSDSESFAKYKIPRITIHSVTQETWPILHSSKDNLSAIKMDDTMRPTDCLPLTSRFWTAIWMNLPRGKSLRSNAYPSFFLKLSFTTCGFA